MARVSDRILGLAGRLGPEERPDVAGAFLTLFGFTAGHALLETARDALFLARLPAARLPWVYLAIAVLALVLVEQQSKILRRFSSRNELAGWLVFAAIVTFSFWLVGRWAGSWYYYALYVWTGVLATLMLVRFWTQMSGLFTVTQAKRVYALVGTGSVLGAIVGTGLARLLADAFPARDLLLAAAGAFLLAAPGTRFLGRGAATQPNVSRGAGPARQLTRVVRLIWSRKYLQRVAVMILVAAVTFTLVDFIFKSAVDRAVEPQRLGSFFATVYLTLNLLSLLVQILLVGWLIRRLGVNRALAFVPALLILGALGVASGGGLVAALILKGADGSLRHSLFRTGAELFFVPLPLDLRVRVKPVIDILGQRGGQALASLIILALLALTSREAAFAALAGVLATVWLFLVLDLRRHYLDVFRESLTEEVARARWQLPELDVVSLEALLGSLSDEDDRRVLTALEILAAHEKLAAVPGFVLHHASPRVVIRALELFTEAGRTDVLTAGEWLRAHPDPEVRRAFLRAVAALAPVEASLSEGLEDPSPAVRATAVAGLAGVDSTRLGELAPKLDAIARNGTTAERVALAQAAQAIASPVLEDALNTLLHDEDVVVRREAVRAAGRVKSERFVSLLTQLLSERSQRDEARNALVRIGATAFERLAKDLREPGVPLTIRRHIPAVIAAFGTTTAADVLVVQLHVETDGMVRFKILQALGRLRRRQPGIPLDVVGLRRIQAETLRLAFRLLGWRRALEREMGRTPAMRTPEGDLLVALLRDKQDHALERLFRTLNLETRNDDFFRIYRGLQSEAPQSRANSRELLEHLVPRRSRIELMPLIEDLYGQPSEAVSIAEPAQASVTDVLRDLLDSPTETLSSLAAAYVAAAGLHELREVVEARVPLSPGHATVLATARATLAEDQSTR